MFLPKSCFFFLKNARVWKKILTLLLSLSKRIEQIMRKLVCIFLMLLPALWVHAQSEGGRTLHPDSQVKDFGGFILDMGSISNFSSR
mgnify:CR=1 FL=1